MDYRDEKLEQIIFDTFKDSGDEQLEKEELEKFKPRDENSEMYQIMKGVLTKDNKD